VGERGHGWHASCLRGSQVVRKSSGGGPSRAADPRHKLPASCPLAACSHGCKVANRLKTNVALTEEEDNCDCVSVSNRYFGPWAVSLGWQLIWSYDAL
jgi:hypothetical protein